MPHLHEVETKPKLRHTKVGSIGSKINSSVCFGGNPWVSPLVSSEGRPRLHSQAVKERAIRNP